MGGVEHDTEFLAGRWTLQIAVQRGDEATILGLLDDLHDFVHYHDLALDVHQSRDVHRDVQRNVNGMYNGMYKQSFIYTCITITLSSPHVSRALSVQRPIISRAIRLLKRPFPFSRNPYSPDSAVGINPYVGDTPKLIIGEFHQLPPFCWFLRARALCWSRSREITE